MLLAMRGQPERTRVVEAAWRKSSGQVLSDYAVRRFPESTNLSREIGAPLNIDNTQVRAYLKGQRVPTIRILLKLLPILDRDLNQFGVDLAARAERLEGAARPLPAESRGRVAARQLVQARKGTGNRAQTRTGSRP
jgi:transcriptional regulator with XRE-family HTH domain